MNAPLIYWFPGIQRLEEIPDEALRRRLLDGPIAKSRNTAGPGEGLGLLACRFPGAVVSCDPDRQTWHELMPGCWIGIDQDASPQAFLWPDGSGRGLPGQHVQLGPWTMLLPLVNPDIEPCSLPLVPWPQGGVILHRVRSCYSSIAERAKHFHGLYRQQFLADREQPVQADEAAVLQFLADVIAINYDLSLTELLALEILDLASIAVAMELVTGWTATMDQLSVRMAGEVSHG